MRTIQQQLNTGTLIGVLQATTLRFILLVIATNAFLTVTLSIVGEGSILNQTKQLYLILFGVCHLPLALSACRRSLAIATIVFALALTVTAMGMITATKGVILAAGLPLVMTATFIALIYRRPLAMAYLISATILGLYASHLAHPLTDLARHEVVMRAFASAIVIGSGWISITLALTLMRNITELLRKNTRQNDAQRNLLQTMNHEMRSPIAAINLLANDSRYAAHQTAIDALSRHLLDLLSGFKRAIQKETLGQVRVQPFDPHRLTYEIKAEVKSLLEKQHVKLTVENKLPANELLRSDPYRLKTIFSDIIMGIARVGANEGIHLVMYRDIVRERLCVTLRTTEGDLPLERMSSLTEGVAPQVFEENEISLLFHLSKVWIDKFGGEVTLTPQTEINPATLSISLPAKAQTMVEPQEKGDSLIENARVVLANKRVLLIEDNTVMRSLHSQLIAKHFLAKVDTATDGGSALKQIIDQDYDLVITGYLMPQIRGDEFIQLMRLTGNDTRVIGLTAATVGNEIQALYSAGADYVLKKPLDIELLSQAIIQAWREDTDVDPTDKRETQSSTSSEANDSP